MDRADIEMKARMHGRRKVERRGEWPLDIAHPKVYNVEGPLSTSSLESYADHMNHMVCTLLSLYLLVLSRWEATGTSAE